MAFSNKKTTQSGARTQYTTQHGGSWERGSLSFLVDSTWVAWAFVHLGGTNNMLVSRLPVPCADLLMMFCAKRAIRGNIIIGIATNTSCRDEIASAVYGEPQGAVAAVAAVLSSASCKAFRYNGKAFGPKADAIRQLRGIVQFSIVDRRYVSIAVPGRRTISARMPAELAESVSCHCFVMLPWSISPDDVRPCWSRRA